MLFGALFVFSGTECRRTEKSEIANRREANKLKIMVGDDLKAQGGTTEWQESTLHRLRVTKK